MDFQAMAGMFTGIGQMIQNPIETIDIPSEYIMGRWYQVYKAAVNFDVYRTQTYCPVAYCKLCSKGFIAFIIPISCLF